jgi:bifunctional DNA-binding transcriptional regulator/antitoxin component of YhaV-PrlF toxin-antitoxin module
LRKRHGLKPGSLVEFREQGGRIVIIPRVTDVIEDLYGKLAGKTSLTKALLEDRAKELEREEANLRTG